MIQRMGAGSIRFCDPPVILSSCAVGGKKEAEGPLADAFDILNKDTRFGTGSWEKAERKMQQLALDGALQKQRLNYSDLDLMFAGDLLNQCISSSFSLRDKGIPVLGLYGACSTMAEGLCLAGMSIAGGAAQTAGVLTSSHFAASERQYRFPLNYGGQRTPTAQWTVTGSGCAILGSAGDGPRLLGCTVGNIVDMGIKDANNMGAAMAPAAYDTIRRHLDAFSLAPEDYDLIVTGDLGDVGAELLQILFRRDGVETEAVYRDCGTMIFDRQTQDVHAGGSGCGCSAVVLCGHLLKELRRGNIKKLLFCGTGAMLSPTSTQQGESIPGVCHAVTIVSQEVQEWTM